MRLKVSVDLVLDQTVSVGGGKHLDPAAANKYWNEAFFRCFN